MKLSLNNYSILTRLIIAFSLVISINIVILLVAFINSGKITNAFDRINHTQKVLTYLAETENRLVDLETGQRGFIITGNLQYLEPYNKSLGKIDSLIVSLRNLTTDNLKQIKRIDLLEELINSKLSELKSTIELRKNEGFDAAKKVVITHVGKKLMDKIRIQIEQIKNEELRLMAVQSLAPMKVISESRFIIFAILSISIIFAIIIAYYIAQSIIIPIKALQDGTKIVRTGNLDYKIGTNTKDEIGQLSRSFEFMLHELKNTMASKKLLEHEIKIRKQREKEIAKLSLVVKQSPIAVVITNTNGLIEYVNPLFEKVTGYDAQSVIGKTPQILKSGKHPDSFYKEMWNTIKSGKEWRAEFYNKKKDGAFFWELAHIFPIFDEQRNISNFIKISEDITYHKQVEEEVRQSRANLKALIENANDMIWSVDSEYKLLTANSIFINNITSLLGNEIKKGTLLLDKSKITTKLYNQWKKYYDRALSGEHYSVEIFDKHVKGVEYIEVSFNPIVDNNDNIIGVSAIGRDITEHKLIIKALEKAKLKLEESEANLIKSNRSKDKFFSIIAHDLKGPFNSLLGFSNLLHEGFDDYSEDEKKEFVKIIKTGLENTLKLIENLLVWSRSQRNKIEFNPETENPYLLCKETLSSLQLTAQKKSIRIKNLIPKDTLVNVDKYMFSTIIRNLVSNAIKFTNKNGEIVISVDMNSSNANSDKFVKLIVRDNGVGIPIEAQSKLFDIGEDVSTKGTDNETGTGLGLSLCKEFVEKHGGRIWVKSEVGKGTSIHFTLPKA